MSEAFVRRVQIPGRVLLGAGVAGLGWQNFADSRFLPGLQPWPADAQEPRALAGLLGLALLLAGATLAANLRPRLGALLAGLVFLACLAFLHARTLLAAPDDGGAWGGAFQMLGLFAASLALAATAGADRLLRPRENAVVDRLGLPARLAFGAALVAFGVLHLKYHAYMSGLIPAWIPGTAWWPYLTGVAQLAAGASLLGGIQTRPAALLAGAMYASWIVLVHLPRLLVAPGAAVEWTGLFLACALAGGAWLVAGAPRTPAAAVR